MKSVRLVTLLLLACLALTLTGCKRGAGGPVMTVAKDFIIEFSAAAADTKITVVSPNQGCTSGGGANKGCVQFNKHEKGTIFFELNKNNTSRSCGDTPKADWVITRIQLSAEGNRVTGKGAFPKKPRGWMKKAFPGINQNNGVVFEKTVAKASGSASIADENNHRSWLGVREVHYEVTASNCDAQKPKTISIDPSVRNKGR